MQTGGVTFLFGRFTLDPSRRALLADGAPVAVSSRAFDVLQLLIEGRARVLGKDEIIATVWRGVAVEENNLAVQISALRRALVTPDAPSPIATIPGQGYRFIGEVFERELVAPDAIPEPAPPEPLQAPGPAPPTPPASRRSRPRFAAATALAALTLTAALFLARSAGLLGERPPPPRLSLVVMPFRNLSGDPKQDYLADAISDDLTTDLSHIPGSTVIARASSDTYKGRAVPASTVGRTLGVRYLLEGSVRGEDGIFRINAQLIDTANGGHLWADRFEVNGAHVAEAQAQIVTHIASALNTTLVAIEGQRSARDRPKNPDALDLFFQARSIMDRAQTLQEFAGAQSLLERATDLQPDFAEAVSALGLVLLTKSNDFDDPDDAADVAQARQAIGRALALAPNSAQALAAQGALNASDGRYQEARASYDAAIAADPNSVLGRAGRAVCAFRLGDPQAAISELQQVLRLDPLGPSVKKRYAMLGMANFLLGPATGPKGPAPDNKAAIEALLQSLAGDPDRAGGSGGRAEWSRAFLIAALADSGQLDRARREYTEFNTAWPRRSVWRMASFFSKAQTSLPRFANWKAGLIAAGMPEFAPATPPANPAGAAETPHSGGDFDPIPAQAPNAATLDAPALKTLLAQPEPPTILDVGPGAATIPNAAWQPGATPSALAALAAHAPPSGIVVMSAGPYGWAGWNAATLLARTTTAKIAWLRGGEEAWAASGEKAVDRRSP